MANILVSVASACAVETVLKSPSFIVVSDYLHKRLYGETQIITLYSNTDPIVFKSVVHHFTKAINELTYLTTNNMAIELGPGENKLASLLPLEEDVKLTSNDIIKLHISEQDMRDLNSNIKYKFVTNIKMEIINKTHDFDPIYKLELQFSPDSLHLNQIFDPNISKHATAIKEIIKNKIKNRSNFPIIKMFMQDIINNYNMTKQKEIQYFEIVNDTWYLTPYKVNRYRPMESIILKESYSELILKHVTKMHELDYKAKCHMLFYGNAGSGKSSLVCAIASYIKHLMNNDYKKNII
jgi:hypothetical protein